VIAPFSLLTQCSTLFGTPCERAEDCRGSDESKSAGRCGPEVACIDGRCHAECLGTCDGLSAQSRFPVVQCSTGAICNAPARDGAPNEGRCTKRPVRCDASDDCPLTKPSDAGEWTCDDGTCAFPGFAYAHP
jgi:hypothetical protein